MCTHMQRKRETEPGRDGEIDRETKRDRETEYTQWLATVHPAKESMQEWTEDVGGMLSHPQADYNVSMDRDRSFKIETVSGTVLIVNESQHVERHNQEPSKFPPAYRLTYKRNFWALHTYNYSCKLWGSSRTCGHTHCNHQSTYLVLLGQIPTAQRSKGIILQVAGALPQLCTWAQRRQKEHRNCAMRACLVSTGSSWCHCI